MIKPLFGNRLDALSSISSSIMDMFEGGRTNNNEEFDVDEEFDEESDEESAESILESLLAGVNADTEVKRTLPSRVVVPVRNGNVTVVVPTDKEEKRNLITKINSLLPNTADKVATEKLNSHTIEELEAFYKQLQGKADALSEEGEFDLD